MTQMIPSSFLCYVSERIHMQGHIFHILAHRGVIQLFPGPVPRKRRLNFCQDTKPVYRSSLKFVHCNIKKWRIIITAHAFISFECDLLGAAHKLRGLGYPMRPLFSTNGAASFVSGANGRLPLRYMKVLRAQREMLGADDAPIISSARLVTVTLVLR